MLTDLKSFSTCRLSNKFVEVRPLKIYHASNAMMIVIYR